MPDLTNEEYDALDELWTKTTPAIDTSKPGYYTQNMAHLVEVDDFSADWLRVKAAAEHTTPEALIGALVRKEIAASA